MITVHTPEKYNRKAQLGLIFKLRGYYMEFDVAKPFLYILERKKPNVPRWSAFTLTRDVRCGVDEIAVCGFESRVVGDGVSSCC